MANHNAVAHAWAHQTGKHRKGFNMYYEGDTIYSYGSHFPIARLVESPNAGQVVLFTTEGYSRSTAKHKTYTRRACNHLTVFDVPNVRAEGERAHGENWQAFIERTKASIDKAKRARTYKDMHLRNATQALADADEYRLAFGLDRPCVTMESLEPAIADMRRQAALEAARNEAAIAERNRKILREQRADAKPIIRRWLRGEDVGSRIYGTNRPLCRVKGDVVETSWGASVPLVQAVEMFRFATKVRQRGEGMEFAGLAGRKVGDFALTRIGPTGNMVIGCHDIPYRFAKLAAEMAGIYL